MSKLEYLPAMFKRGKNGNWSIMGVFDDCTKAQACREEFVDADKIFIIEIPKNFVGCPEEIISALDSSESSREQA